jgi:colanic acid/amylovoran biosynthesis glycosyltransferase
MFKHDMDWLHFGFGTIVLDCQNVATAINSKMAVSFRGFDIGVYPIRHPNCYQKTWENVDKIHVISDDIAQLVIQQGFKNQAPMVKITPAIDTSYFLKGIQHKLYRPIKIITVARLHWKKGLHYTLEALALLKQVGINFEYSIIGAGPEEEALKFTVYQLGLQEQVVFLGKLDQESVKYQLSISHIYIQYSVQEGFCNAVLEAQAMNLLCVVSNAEGLTENVLDGQTGWVVDKRRPDLLAEKISAILDMNEDEQETIRRNARNRVMEEFNLQKQQKEFHQFYAD